MKLVDLIIELWTAHLSSFLKTVWQSLSYWRTLSLILISLIALVIVFRREIIDLLFEGRNKEHDKNIFNSSNQILSERHLIEFLDELETDDAYFLHECRPITAFCEFFRETGNQYRTKALKKHSDELLKALKELVTFLAYQG